MLSKKLKNNGFTLIEVLISMAIIAFSSLIIASLFSDSLKLSMKESNIQKNSIKSKSNLENGIVKAKELSAMYEKNKKSIKKNQDKPQMFDINQIRIDNNRININKLMGYNIYANSDKYSVNKELSNYDLYTFISEGYALPTLANFDEVDGGKLYVEGKKRFSYFYADTNTPKELHGFYKVTKTGKDLVAMVRYGWHRSKNYDKTKGTFILPYTDEDIDFGFVGKNARCTSDAVSFLPINKAGFKGGYKTNKLKEDNVFAQLPNYDELESLDILDNSFFLSAQTLNTNGYAGKDTFSYNGKGSGEFSSVHFIGLPFLKYMLNHNDADLAVRQDKNNPNIWYTLSEKYRDNAQLNNDFFSDGKFSWKDVRDYTDNKDVNGMYKLDYAQVKGAFDFSKVKGDLMESDGVSNTVAYDKSVVIKPVDEKKIYYPGTNASDFRTIIIKLVLNEKFTFDDPNVQIKQEPYRILNVNLDESGEIKNYNKFGIGFQIFIDNNNKLWLSTVASKDVVELKNVVKKTEYKLYDIVSDYCASNLGLYDSKVYPYFFKPTRTFIKTDKLSNREKYIILAIELYKNDIGISMLGYDDSNNFTYYTKVYDLSTPFSKSILDMTSYTDSDISIGGNEFKAKNESGNDVDNLNPIKKEDKLPVRISEFLYYDKPLLHMDPDGSSISQYSNKNAMYFIMDYLYRQSLTDVERASFDPAYIVYFK